MESAQLLQCIPSCLRNLPLILYVWNRLVFNPVDKILTCIQLLYTLIINTVETNAGLLIKFTACTFVWEFTPLQMTLW